MNFNPTYIQQEKFLDEYIQQGEHQQQDFKKTVSNATKIAKTICAFANGQGGRLLIGVDDEGEIQPVEVEEEMYMVHLAATEYCRPPVMVDFIVHESQDGDVLEAKIGEKTNVVHAAQDQHGEWKVYVRDRDRVINMCSLSKGY